MTLKLKQRPGVPWWVALVAPISFGILGVMALFDGGWRTIIGVFLLAASVFLTGNVFRAKAKGEIR